MLIDNVPAALQCIIKRFPARPYDKFGTKDLSQCLCYRTTQDGYTYKRDGKLALSNSALITLDWSEDSYNIAAVTADFHLVHAGKSLFYIRNIGKYFWAFYIKFANMAASGSQLSGPLGLTLTICVMSISELFGMT